MSYKKQEAIFKYIIKMIRGLRVVVQLGTANVCPSMQRGDCGQVTKLLTIQDKFKKTALYREKNKFHTKQNKSPNWHQAILYSVEE